MIDSGSETDDQCAVGGPKDQMCATARRPSADDCRLFESALTGMTTSYSPNSGFRVGAALRTDQHNLHSGTNIRNAAYPVGICAEQSAVSGAVSACTRRIVSVAVAGDSGTLSPLSRSPL